MPPAFSAFPSRRAVPATPGERDRRHRDCPARFAFAHSRGARPLHDLATRMLDSFEAGSFHPAENAPLCAAHREPVHPRVAVDLARGKLVVEPAEASRVLDRRWAALPARHDVVELAPWLLDEPLPLRVALEEEI